MHYEAIHLAEGALETRSVTVKQHPALRNALAAQNDWKDLASVLEKLKQDSENARYNCIRHSIDVIDRRIRPRLELIRSRLRPVLEAAIP